MPKFTNIPTNSTPAQTDFLLGVSAGAVDQKTTIATILSMLYPVGSVYTNATDNTNPGTLLGFGTWAAFAAGRVPVGVGTSDVAFTAGATGGESNHTLSQAEMPSHQHRLDRPNSAYGASTASTGYGGNVALSPGASGDTSIYNTATGGGGAHNNLQPFVVVYMWKRTA